MNELGTAPDGTPWADLLAELTERRAEIAALKARLREIHRLSLESPTLARRLSIKCISHRDYRG